LGGSSPVWWRMREKFREKRR